MGQVIYNFFWWLAGANRKILKEHIVDHDKYFQIGMAVLITALMATLTGGFAFHYASNKGFTGDVSPFTIIASIFWGFIILNLDRFLVLSMQKQGSSLVYPTTYEKFQNFMGEFIFAIPRIVLAVLIASVILEPLELYLFKDQISNHISIINEKEKEQFIKLKRDELSKIDSKYLNDKNLIEDKYINLIKLSNIKIDNLKATISKLRTPQNNTLDKLRKDLKDAKKIAKDNRVSTKMEANNGGCKKRCKKLGALQVGYDEHVSSIISKIELETNKENLKLSDNNEKISKLENKIKYYNKEITKLEDNKSRELNKLILKKQKDKQVITHAENQYKNKYQGNNIMIALKAKDSLFENDGKYDSIHSLLWLLLLVIELLPLIVKLLLSRSSYDAHMQRISYEESIKHDAFIRDEKLKYQMLFKSLRLRKNIEYETLDKELKKVKFSSNE